jgi:hypothetical protein
VDRGWLPLLRIQVSIKSIEVTPTGAAVSPVLREEMYVKMFADGKGKGRR